MSQGKKDKFIPIFFGVLGVGTLALGYLGWSASSAADDAEAAYKKSVSDLATLEKAPLSRTEDNAKKKKGLVDAYVKQVKELSTTMLAYQAPLNDKESNESFQRKLSEATRTIKENAAARQVKLGDKFDLGMGHYLADFPVPGSAPRLSAQLDAIVYLTNAALEAGVTEVNALIRPELDFEREKKEEAKSDLKEKKPASPAAAKPAAVKDKVKKDAASVVDESTVLERQPLSLTLTGKNDSLLRFLQSIANSSPEKAPHFFVIRTLRIENESKDGPSKTIQPTLEEKPDPNNKDAPPIKTDAIYLLGFESVKLHAEIDLVRFIPAPTEGEKGKPAKPEAAAN